MTVVLDHGKHTDCTLDFSEIAPRHNGGWLVVDADLEASRAPVNELNRAPGLDCGDGIVDIFRHDIASIQ